VSASWSGTGYGNEAFTGREWDPETELYYYRARYHDPEAGRCVSEDPIGFAGGMNVFAHVANGPAMFGDPFGLRMTVEGYVSSDHAAVLGLLTGLETRTQKGKQLVDALIGDPDRNVTITLGARTRWDPRTDTIYFNPNVKVPVETENGWGGGTGHSGFGARVGPCCGPDRVSGLRRAKERQRQ
jgi:RHS repeat-associated protein